MVKRLFSTGEAFDAEGFINFFTDTPVYQFGNFEVCLDKAAIKKAAEDFFSRILAVSHEIKMMWEVGDVVFAEMDVIYRRQDSSIVTLPCFDIFRLEGDKFSELRIFMDVNPLFDPTIPVPDTASVFTISQGKKLTAPHIIQSFFAEHAEGIKRVETGFARKGSTNGHNASNSRSAKSVSKVDLVMDMETAGGAGNWDYFKTFFVEDVYFKVGASQEKRGVQAIRDYLTWLFEIAEPNMPFEFRGTWDLGDVVIIEMDAKYIRRTDGKPVSFPCTDILRFEDNKIREWRVYPDQSELWMNEKVKQHGPRTYR
jgi:ketosteroid isomerase-like protein